MIEFYKEAGLTPLEFINNIKKQFPDKKICYTARLDPLARGVIPVLFGEECKKIVMYTNLSKIYEVKIIIGYKTDTDDVMGLIENTLPDNILFDMKYEDFIEKYKSYFEIENEITINQKFHYYSTKALSSRSKNNNEEYHHNVKLFRSKIIDNGELDFTEWVNKFCNIIEKVDKTKNFRQKEIIEQWKNLLLNENNTNPKNIHYINLQLHVGSGFFVRQFIRDISDKIGIPLLCYDINRISIDYI
jgi:tRNA U55 pseudouridine synthase TruB